LKQLGRAGRVVAWAVLIAGIVLIIGALAVAWMSPPWQLKVELSAVQLLQLGLTLVVTFYLQQYLSVKSGERKAEQGLLLQQITEATASLKRVDDAFAECCKTPGQPTMQAAVRALRDFGTALVTLQELGLHCSVDKDDLKEVIERLRQVRTTVSKDLPNLPGHAEQADAETAINRMRHCLLFLALKIQRG